MREVFASIFQSVCELNIKTVPPFIAIKFLIIVHQVDLDKSLSFLIH